MCRFHTHGYCSTPCASCDRRLRFAADRIARKDAARASLLMRAPARTR